MPEMCCIGLPLDRMNAKQTEPATGVPESDVEWLCRPPPSFTGMLVPRHPVMVVETFWKQPRRFECHGSDQAMVVSQGAGCGCPTMWRGTCPRHTQHSGKGLGSED